MILKRGKSFPVRKHFLPIVSHGHLMGRGWSLPAIWRAVFGAGRSAQTKLCACSINARVVPCKLHGRPMESGSRQDKPRGQFVCGPWQRTSAMDLSKKRIKMLCSALHGHPMEINWRLAEVLFEFGIPILENSSDRSDSIALPSIPIWNGLDPINHSSRRRTGNQMPQ